MNNKALKRLGSLALAGTIVFSLAGCQDISPATTDSVELVDNYDENGNKLMVMALVSKAHNKVLREEFYGYFKTDSNHEKLEFYDVLNDKLIDLKQEMLKNYDVYCVDITKCLYDYEIKNSIINGGVPKDVLRNRSENGAAGGFYNSDKIAFKIYGSKIFMEKLDVNNIYADDAKTKETAPTMVKGN